MKEKIKQFFARYREETTLIKECNMKIPLHRKVDLVLFFILTVLMVLFSLTGLRSSADSYVSDVSGTSWIINPGFVAKSASYQISINGTVRSSYDDYRTSFDFDCFKIGMSSSLSFDGVVSFTRSVDGVVYSKAFYSTDKFSFIIEFDNSQSSGSSPTLRTWLSENGNLYFVTDPDPEPDPDPDPEPDPDHVYAYDLRGRQFYCTYPYFDLTMPAAGFSGTFLCTNNSTDPSQFTSFSFDSFKFTNSGDGGITFLYFNGSVRTINFSSNLGTIFLSFDMNSANQTDSSTLPSILDLYFTESTPSFTGDNALSCFDWYVPSGWTASSEEFVLSSCCRGSVFAYTDNIVSFYFNSIGLGYQSADSILFQYYDEYFDDFLVDSSSSLYFYNVNLVSNESSDITYFLFNEGVYLPEGLISIPGIGPDQDPDQEFVIPAGSYIGSLNPLISKSLTLEILYTVPGLGSFTNIEFYRDVSDPVYAYIRYIGDSRYIVYNHDKGWDYESESYRYIIVDSDWVVTEEEYNIFFSVFRSSVGSDESYNSGYDDGYLAGIERNFLGEFFAGVLDALDKLVIFNGYSYLTIVTTLLGLMALLWFLKLLSGG